MGLPVLLNVLQSLPPFAVEIIVVTLLIILLACPVPLAEYYTSSSDRDTCVRNLPANNYDVGESSVPRNVPTRPQSDATPGRDVPEVLEHTSSLIRLIENTLHNIDKTNNDIIVNHLDLCDKISNATFARVFELDAVDRNEDVVVAKDLVDADEAATEPLSSVDAVRGSSRGHGRDMDSEGSNVSDGSDIGATSGKHNPIARESDAEQIHSKDSIAHREFNYNQMIDLRRTYEHIYLSNICIKASSELNCHLWKPVKRPDSIENELNCPICKSDVLSGFGVNDSSLTDLILDNQLDLNKVKKSIGGQEPGCLSSESDSLEYDDLFRCPLADEESETGLLAKVLSSPCNTKGQRRSLDSLKEGSDFQDLKNISVEDLERNQEFFVDKFINVEEIKKHARSTRSKKTISIENIPISRNPLQKSEFEAEDKYINPKFTATNSEFAFDIDVPINVGGNEMEGGIAPSELYVKSRRHRSNYESLSTISEESVDKKARHRYKSFSALSDLQTKNALLDNFHVNSDALLWDDFFINRYEALLNYVLGTNGTPDKSNPLVNGRSKPFEDTDLNKSIKGENAHNSESEQLKTLHSLYKQSSDKRKETVSVPVPIPSFNNRNPEKRLHENGSNVKEVTNVNNLPAQCSWASRENVKTKKLVFDKDTFLRMKESFNLFTSPVGSMNNLLDVSNSSFGSKHVHIETRSGKDIASTSHAERDPTDDVTACDWTRAKSRRRSLPKLKLPTLKTKSREKSNTDSSLKVKFGNLRDSLSLKKIASKKSKTNEKESKGLKQSKVMKQEDENITSAVQNGSQSESGPSGALDGDDDLTNGTITRLLHKITRKLKGSPRADRQTNDKNMRVQNKVYVFKGKQGGNAFPTEDPIEAQRNAHSMDYFYSELQSEHHSLKVSSNEIDIPASGSSTNNKTDLHLASLMEDEE